MPSVTLSDGTRICYEVHGAGPAVALTPGGRGGMETLRSLALRVAEAGHRVIIWDRRNCGASDVVIARRHGTDGRNISEQEIFAEDLYELLGRLNARPCWVGGVSAGCRVSLLLAMRHPHAVKGLLVWMVTGGPIAAERLGHLYYGQFIETAEREGMEGVLRTEFFAERVQQNPSNQERLLRMDAREFIAIMSEWRTFFTAEGPVIGVTEQALRRIAVPAVIIAGNDEVHSRTAAEGLHRLLPQSELHPPLWSPEERERLAASPEAYRTATAEKVGPILLAFLAKSLAAN